MSRYCIRCGIKIGWVFDLKVIVKSAKTKINETFCEKCAYISRKKNILEFDRKKMLGETKKQRMEK